MRYVAWLEVILPEVMAHQTGEALKRLPTAGLHAWHMHAEANKLFQYDGPLDEVDPEIASIIKNEKNRQVRTGLP